MNMSRNVVTTELVADQPVVVVLHHDEFLGNMMLKELAASPVQVESFTIAQLLESPEIRERLSSCYKIVWVTNLEMYLQQPDALQLVSTWLIESQHKLSIVVPVITTFQEQFTGETPFISDLSTLQRDMILFLNSYVPSATFLFGQDLIDPALTGGFLYVVCQHLQQGILYSPQIMFHPQTTDSFVKRAVRYFLQPQRVSVLVRGNSVAGESMAHNIKTLYQSYHFSPVELQLTLGSLLPTIPFSVIENFVTEDISVPLKTFVQQFPTPQAKPLVLSWSVLLKHRAQTSKQGASVAQFSTEAEDLTLQTTPQENVSPSSTLTQAMLATPVSTAQEQSEPAAVAVAETKTQTKSNPEELPTKAPITKTDQDFNLHQEIQRVFTETHLATKKVHTSRIKEKKQVFKKKSTKRTSLFYGGLAFTGMGLGVLCLAAFFLISVRMLRSSVTDYLVAQARTEQASTSDTAKLQQIRRLNSIVAVQAQSYKNVVSLPAVEDAERLVTLSTGLLSVSEQLQQSRDLVKILYSQLVGTDNGDAVVTAENLTVQSLTAYEKLAALDEQLSNAAVPFESSPATKSTIEQYGKSLEELRSSTQILQQIKPLFGDWIGAQKRRTYAVLLQNNQELRPTGGFIEAVALLTFEGGSLTSSRVISSYEVDKLINGVVIPPVEVKKYLNEESWNFVDSNWDPHFPKSAEQITLFLEKSMNLEIDGVVMVDLYGIARMLEATGPLALPEYNEELTQKNIHSIFEFHSEVSLVNTSADYRQKFFDAFIKKLITLPPEKAGPLFSAMKRNLESQSMLLAFKQADELQTIKVLGWSGSLLQPNCPSPLQSSTCLVDVISQVEANVGVNKANYHLNRSIDHSITIMATEAAHLRQITFENTAQTDAWPKGMYKVFTRLYIPSSARLSSIVINGVALPKNQITESQEHERKVVGFYAEVPIKQTTSVDVKYSVPLPVHESAFAYAFFEQQQPGVGATPLSVTIQSNEKLVPDIIAPQAEFKDNKITFSRYDIGHSFFGVKFSARAK